MSDYKPETNTKLSPSQLSAIRYITACGKELQELYPQIGEDYRKDKRLCEIAEDYDVADRLGVRNESNLRSIVTSALRGNQNDFFGQTYEGLLTVEEYQQIAKDHMAQGGHKQGKRAYESSTGIHSQTIEDKRELGRKTALLQGKTLWDTDEKEQLIELAKSGLYMNGHYYSNKKLAQQLNVVVHKGKKIRSPAAVRSVLRQLEKEGEL